MPNLTHLNLPPALKADIALVGEAACFAACWGSTGGDIIDAHHLTADPAIIAACYDELRFDTDDGFAGIHEHLFPKWEEVFTSGVAMMPSERVVACAAELRRLK